MDRTTQYVNAALEDECLAADTLDRIAVGCCDPDLLTRTIAHPLEATDGPGASEPTLRAVCRAIQKALEVLHAVA